MSKDNVKKLIAEAFGWDKEDKLLLVGLEGLIDSANSLEQVGKLTLGLFRIFVAASLMQFSGQDNRIIIDKLCKKSDTFARVYSRIRESTPDTMVNLCQMVVANSIVVSAFDEEDDVYASGSKQIAHIVLPKDRVEDIRSAVFSAVSSATEYQEEIGTVNRIIDALEAVGNSIADESGEPREPVNRQPMVDALTKKNEDGDENPMITAMMAILGKETYRMTISKFMMASISAFALLQLGDKVTITQWHELRESMKQLKSFAEIVDNMPTEEQWLFRKIYQCQEKS